MRWFTCVWQFNKLKQLQADSNVEAVGIVEAVEAAVGVVGVIGVVVVRKSSITTKVTEPVFE